MPGSVADSTQTVEDQLVASGLVTADKMAGYKQQAAAAKQPLVSFLLAQKVISDEDFTRITAHIAEVPYVNLNGVFINHKVLELLPEETANRYMAVPLGEMKSRLVVAMLDATNVQAVDFLSQKIGRPLRVYAASEAGIKNILTQYKTKISDSEVAALKNIGDDQGQIVEEGDNKKKPKVGNIQTIVQDSPVSKALTTILEFAANNRASDIHIEPSENDLKIRCRIDGVLREIMTLPKAIEPALISRVKILSTLKIDEHRVPQDGEFTVKVGDKAIDLRIAISPVIWGEQVVIRLLDKTGTSLHLEDMGYRGRAIRLIREGIKSSSGMILTSGPTGSGKSTSLYALLQEVKSDTVNIVTLEDPVEYKMDGINQIQVNTGVGLTFAAGLRSILRQDPDIVMVGEIRDRETADLAVQASLTGHLVFSTLHTNSAAGILPRLLDMGIEPFLIASTVRTVIGQRLVRRVADKNETYQSGVAETAAIKETIGSFLPKSEKDRAKAQEDLGVKNLPLLDQDAYTLTKGVDSPDSPGGYKGRMGLYEVFNVSEKIQELILKRATSAEIQEVAAQEGMLTMRQDGYFKALDGMTTLSEVDRVASEGVS